MELSPESSKVGLFATVVQHEVNNPLSYVMSNLEYLAKRLTELRRDLPPAVADELDETARDAMDGAQRIRRLMMALRALGTFGGDEQPAPLDVGEVVEASLSAVRSQVRHRATLVCCFVPIPPVMASERELTQVLVSVLLNAVESIAPGDVLRNGIRVMSGVEGGQAFIDVHDTGSGIRPEHRSRIFEPFFTTKGAERGAGLGLSMARHSLRAMGGNIQVRSEWGKGTTVHILLPLARPMSSALARIGDAHVDGEAPARVLVIDDDSLVGRAIKRVLVGHDVTTLNSGEEAVALMQRDQNFDVVLCDLIMPRMSGMAVQARVRQFAPALAERFSFITGGAYTPETRTFVEQTPQRVMRKPLMTDDLRGVIERELASHRRVF